jgi:Cysteine-rich CWC
MAADSHRRVVCARCGAEFGCGGDSACWCAHVEVRLPIPQAGDDCLCPGCLQAVAFPPATSGET